MTVMWIREYGVKGGGESNGCLEYPPSLQSQTWSQSNLRARLPLRFCSAVESPVSRKNSSDV